MGFWIYMFLFSLLIPLIMIIIGNIFRKRSPKEINRIVGFRTPLSMKNRDTWDFSHRHIGKIWFISGIVMLPISVVVMLTVIGQPMDSVGITGGVLIGVQTAYIVISIIPTMIALRKNFDKWGFRRN